MYRTTVAGGTPRWFALDLAEGQTLAVDVVQPPVPGLRGIGADLDMRLLLGEAQVATEHGYADGDGETFQLHDSLGRPGRYLVEVAVDRGAFPLTLRVDLSGEQPSSAAPAVPPGVAPTAEPAPASEGGDALSAVPWVMGAIVALGFLSAAAVVILVNRQARSRPTGD